MSANTIYRYVDIVSRTIQLYKFIKDKTEWNTSASYLDLLQSIGRDGQLRTSLYKRDDFNFIVITNFPFLSSNIHLLLSMVFYLTTHPIRQGLHLLWMFYSEGGATFQAFSGKDMPRNVWNHILGSSMVDTGNLSNNMKPLSPECYRTFWRMTIYSDTLYWWTIIQILHAVTELDLITEFDFLSYCARFLWNICNRCGMPTEDGWRTIFSCQQLASCFQSIPPSLMAQESFAIEYFLT